MNCHETAVITGTIAFQNFTSYGHWKCSFCLLPGTELDNTALNKRINSIGKGPNIHFKNNPSYNVGHVTAALPSFLDEVSGLADSLCMKKKKIIIIFSNQIIVTMWTPCAHVRFSSIEESEIMTFENSCTFRLFFYDYFAENITCKEKCSK